MTHGAAFKDYSNAYTAVTHNRTVVPAAALTKDEIAVRQASAEEERPPRQQEQLRQVGDIMRRVNQFVFLTCICGLKLKIPPNFKAPKVKCPRCSNTLDIPRK